MPFTIPNLTAPNSAAPVGYVAINHLTFNPALKSISVILGGYVDKAAFEANLQPVMTESISIAGTVFDEFLAVATSADLPVGTPQSDILAELIAALQTNLLSLPFFAGATIVA
jgi:hypothetical protein